ncbi:MAG: hypothetical protein AAF500_21645 [Myxococcota bacterium]
MKKVLTAVLFASLALYGCGDDSSGTGATGGAGATGGDGGSGGTGGAGATGGTGGAGATGGAGGMGGMLPPGTIYEQNFDSLDITSDVIGDGWLYFNNVIDTTVNPPETRFGYPEPPNNQAPNGTGNISGLVDDQGGDDQGTQQLSVFSDYGCCDLGGGTPLGHGNGTDQVEVNVFRERTILAEDVGKTLTFSFDAKAGDLAGSTTAAGFIKTLDPNNNFNLIDFVTVDTTGIPETWMRYEVSLLIEEGDVGFILQYGFINTASDFDSSNNFYDNVLVTLPDA